MKELFILHHSAFPYNRGEHFNFVTISPLGLCLCSRASRLGGGAYAYRCQAAACKSEMLPNRAIDSTNQRSKSRLSP